MSSDSRRNKAPIPVPDYEDADVYAIQAVAAGTATAEQQVRALRWIVEKACASFDFCDRPEHERLSAIFDGRRFAGTQIVKLTKLNMAKMNELRKIKQRTEEKVHGR